MQENTEFVLKDEVKHLVVRRAVHKRVIVAAARAEMTVNQYLDSIVPKE